MKTRKKRMLTKDKFFVVNIRKYLALGDNEKVGEQALVGMLSGFFCPQNLDVERFKKVWLSSKRRSNP